ncbi:MAG: hypothetical protein QF464_24205, partial [Myxococcota bacterium]|nr:hypothetical protein [Myxococcota bacterium]
ARSAELLLDDADQRSRETAISVLREVGDEDSVELLEARRRADTVERTSERALKAIKHIRSRAEAPARTPNELEARLEELETRMDDLDEELHGWKEAH